jgi:hypothetical protein
LQGACLELRSSRRRFATPRMVAHDVGLTPKDPRRRVAWRQEGLRAQPASRALRAAATAKGTGIGTDMALSTDANVVNSRFEPVNIRRRRTLRDGATRRTHPRPQGAALAARQEVKSAPVDEGDLTQLEHHMPGVATHELIDKRHHQQVRLARDRHVRPRTRDVDGNGDGGPGSRSACPGGCAWSRGRCATPDAGAAMTHLMQAPGSPEADAAAGRTSQANELRHG